MCFPRRCNYLCKLALRPESDTLNGDLAETLNSAFAFLMHARCPISLHGTVENLGRRVAYRRSYLKS